MLMRKLAILGCAAVTVAAFAAPSGAQVDPGPSSSTTSSSTTTSTTTTTTSTTTTSTTTSTTTPPSTLLPGPPTSDTTTTTTIPPESQECQDPDPDASTTTTSTPTTAPPADGEAPPEPTCDPIGHSEDSPPEEVPITDDTIPLDPGQVVDGLEAERLIRRELDVAKADALSSGAEVAAAANLVDQLSNRLAGLQAELAKLDTAQERTVLRLETADRIFRERVANAVVRGNAAQLDSIVVSVDAVEIEQRQVLIESVTEADIAALEELQAAKRVVDQGILDTLDDVKRTRRELRDARDEFERVLAINAERRFELAVFSAGSEIVIRGFVFPVGEPYNFIDSWGFPRMIGTEYAHGHQGTDIMAPFGTPLYAVERGAVIRVGTDILGGTKLWVKGQSGTYYYYAHLQSYAEGVVEGTLVEAGDIVGFVGDTGNARGGAPHLHFQVHPGGGDAVNPYGLLKVVSDLSRRNNPPPDSLPPP